MISLILSDDLYGKKAIFIMYCLRTCLGLFKTFFFNHCLFLQVVIENWSELRIKHAHKVRYSLRYLKFMWISSLLPGNDGKSHNRPAFLAPNGSEHIGLVILVFF